MGRLPSHHVPRPRLTDQCRGGRARSTLAELGVPLPAELRDFEETLVA